MKRVIEISFFALLACLLTVAAIRGSVPANGPVEGDAINGGRIYNNWMLALDKSPPAGEHPLWQEQSTNPRSGVVTWRCVECHGWDYKGAEGSYSENSSHYTGFPGLGNAIGSSHDEVMAWLDGSNNPDHNFLFYTTSIAVEDLAAFLRTQQIDMDLVIDPSTGVALGDWENGGLIYTESCAGCHAASGAKINFGSVANPLFVGDLAEAEPWRTVHVIRFGTPGGHMPASEELGWSLSRVADVLAYAQTLPRGTPEYGSTLGSATDPTQSERQGDIQPIIWGAFAMIAVVLASFAWDAIKSRNLNQAK
jgi:mono/diheme cytochrome c family protein